MVEIRNLDRVKDVFDKISDELSQVIVGQQEVVGQVLVAILCNGNALLESLPGLAKTTMIKSISQVLDLQFQRIQSTPDLMPSDVIGTYLIEEDKGKKKFVFQKGPIFSNIVLVDEINRATPKTQSALLEAMQEKQVSVGGNTFKLDEPFFVLATQNPIDQEGTYPMPEAQTDRFLLKILVDYPQANEELEIVEKFTSEKDVPTPKVMLSKNSLLMLQKLTRQIPISNDMKKRAVELVLKTRNRKDIIEYGASPRASIALIMTAKARALIEGRKFVSKEDIDYMAFPVLRHRIILNFEAERKGMTTDDAIKELLK
ncbi:MoxR family ATPase [Candidatus Woesearchaeota archaeon]|nr:MoxR family ATPase [Candidatus Woesearchaeota archaeon]